MNKVLSVTLICTAVLTLVLAASTASSRDVQQGDSLMEISLNHDTLSARLNGAPLIRVLTELERQSGIKFHIVEPMKSRPIWADFEALHLEDGIKRLLRGQSYTITYSPNLRSGPHITSISVLEQATDPGAVPLSDPTPTEQALDAEEDGTQKIDELWQLADKDPARAEETLKKALRDKNLEVRESALEVMVNMDQPFISKLLSEMALKDSEPDLRIEALNLLVDHFEDEIFRDTLMKSMEDPDQGVRETAEHLLETVQ